MKSPQVLWWCTMQHQEMAGVLISSQEPQDQQDKLKPLMSRSKNRRPFSPQEANLCRKKAPFSMPQGRKPIHPSELQSIICQIPSPKAKQIQCEEAYQNLFLCLRAFFQEREDEGIDVQKMLLDCWKPLSLQLSLSWYVYFKKSEDLANQTSADQSTCREFEDSDWQSAYLALEMYHAWHRMKRLETVRLNAAADR